MPKLRTTVTIDERVLRAVRVKAARTGRRDSDVIEDALRRDLGFDLLEQIWQNADLDEDGQVDFKGKAKAFVRTYGFLSSILPYSNADWEKLSIFLNFLVPKLPAPVEEDLSKGILEAIDMDSYRVEKQAGVKTRLADEDAEEERVLRLAERERQPARDGEDEVEDGEDVRADDAGVRAARRRARRRPAAGAAARFALGCSAWEVSVRSIAVGLTLCLLFACGGDDDDSASTDDAGQSGSGSGSDGTTTTAAPDADVVAYCDAELAFETAGEPDIDFETMTPEHHDRVLAITSHLPHLIAYTIVGTVADLEDHLQTEVLRYAAGGFTDFTRIAASDPVMWRPVDWASASRISRRCGVQRSPRSRSASRASDQAGALGAWPESLIRQPRGGHLRAPPRPR